MPNDAAERTRPGLAAAIVVGVVVLDLVTKTWAVAELADAPVVLFGDVGFAVTRNTGGAFSLFQGFTPFLALVAAAVAYLLVRAVRRTDDVLLVVALSLVLGGAIGNLVDRLFRSPGVLRGAVVDFVHVDSFPTFNVADSAITIGAILVIVWAIHGGREPRPSGHGRG
ncbi:MAG: signal peptidase II [Acidimicrobiia bacterium]